jgi:DUF971 family protein
MTNDLMPVELHKDGDTGLIIDWSDGERSVLSWPQLRANCPCAGCREEREKPPNPFKMLSDKEASSGPIKPVAMTPIGRYAYKITWSDGHDFGIYTFENLRALGKSQTA